MTFSFLMQSEVHVKQVITMFYSQNLHYIAQTVHTDFSTAIIRSIVKKKYTLACLMLKG